MSGGLRSLGLGQCWAGVVFGPQVTRSHLFQFLGPKVCLCSVAYGFTVTERLSQRGRHFTYLTKPLGRVKTLRPKVLSHSLSTLSFRLFEPTPSKVPRGSELVRVDLPSATGVVPQSRILVLEFKLRREMTNWSPWETGKASASKGLTFTPDLTRTPRS